MTPVMLLTDGYIANAAEPWRVPDMADYQPFPAAFHDTPLGEGEKVNPYARDEKLKRVWIKPGTPVSLTASAASRRMSARPHRLRSGNHQAMTDLRAAKVLGVADSYEPIAPEQGAAARLWRRRLGIDLRPDRAGGAPRPRPRLDVAHVHIRHIWPLPKTWATCCARSAR
jgi:2-oxoglutarate ferredoxin oxidoreductase subunit alpha